MDEPENDWVNRLVEEIEHAHLRHQMEEIVAENQRMQAEMRLGLYRLVMAAHFGERLMRQVMDDSSLDVFVDRAEELGLDSTEALHRAAVLIRDRGIWTAEAFLSVLEVAAE